MRSSISTGAVMRAACLAACLGLVVPGIAAATTYYVGPNGSGTNSGLSPSSPLNVSTLNSRLTAGDIAYVLPGTYTTALKPNNHGRAGARITIIGNLANPAAQTFTSGLTTDRSYLTFKGLKFQGEIGFIATSTTNTARYDSAAWCHARAAHFVGSKNSIICKSVIINDVVPTGYTVAFALDGYNDVGPRPWASNAEFDTLRGNTIDCGYTDYKAFTMRGHSQRNLVDSNRVSIRWKGDYTDLPGGRSMYNSYYNTFRDNFWKMEADNNLSGGRPWTVCGLRDSSSHNVFLRDTIFAGLESGMLMNGWLQHPGNGGWVGNEIGNEYRYCVFRVTQYMIALQIGRNLVIDHCEFASTKGEYALEINNNMKYLTFNHNTCYSLGNRAILIGTCDTSTPADSIRFTNNIFYSRTAQSNIGAMNYLSTSGYVSNNNLFYSPAYSSTPNDRSVGMGGVTRTVPNWCNFSSKDCNSKGGDPLFVNPVTSGLQNLNLRIGANSPARGLAMGGADAGAYSFGTDTSPPTTITSLSAQMVGDNSVVLRWNAPSDNGQAAVGYDLRMATSTITSGNFTSASLLPALPVPLAPGTVQTYIVTGLTKSTAYSFAIKSRDVTGNWSAISNVLNLSTASSDLISPGVVNDLGGGSNE